MGTDGAPVCLSEHDRGLDVPSVDLRPDAQRLGSPASAMEHQTCWLSGTGRPIGGLAGTQTGSLWARKRRCTGLCWMSASWAWCTDGRQRHVVALH